jgi:hypothetical protein
MSGCGVSLSAIFLGSTEREGEVEEVLKSSWRYCTLFAFSIVLPIISITAV